MRLPAETVTSGGRSSGRERKLWYSVGAAVGAAFGFLATPTTAALDEPGSSRSATVKRHANGIVFAPSRSSAWTRHELAFVELAVWQEARAVAL